MYTTLAFFILVGMNSILTLYLLQKAADSVISHRYGSVEKATLLAVSSLCTYFWYLFLSGNWR